MGYTYVYCIMSVLFTILDIVLARRGFKSNKGALSRHLGFACLFGALVQAAYLISVSMDNYLVMSIASTVYFLSIDIMLRFALLYVLTFTQGKIKGINYYLGTAINIYIAFDIVVFFINTFIREIVISYVKIGGMFGSYAYRMHFLYYMHLAFSYFMVTYIMVVLIRRIVRIPREYRKPYYLIILSIFVVVALNAVFLIARSVNLDYSIWGYSIVAIMLYSVVFYYHEGGFVTELKKNVYDNIDQGLVMFDFEDRLILINDKFRRQFGNVTIPEYCRVEEFMKLCDILIDDKYINVGSSLQVYHEKKRFRCDYRIMFNHEGKILGRLFVFTDEDNAMDILTGFSNMAPFVRTVDENPAFIPSPMVVAIFDINGLTAINRDRGRTAGDRMIKDLAENIRKIFPAGSFFLRGTDANLIVLVYGAQEGEVSGLVEKVKEGFEGNVQYAINVMDKPENLVASIEAAESAMKSKKLLDSQSKRSESIKSLLQALESCDTDTEDHVVRTQHMGAELGKRLGLSDAEQSQLSLLCILHDIGKIGIPLEILNKPGKLTDEEWVTMRSHTEKGYQIAKSSTELVAISDMIRYHHERWDGKGYPEGLSGEQIPLLSRIISVVDSYDAMINDRVYRKALSAKTAQEELKRCAGTQFDPHIVKEFLEMLSEPEFARLTEAQVKMVESRIRAEAEEDARRRGDTSKYLHRIHLVNYSKYVLDGDNNVISVDDNFEKITGYSRDYIREHVVNQIEFIPEEDRDEYMSMTLDQLSKNGMAYFEHMLIRKDGEGIVVLCMGKRLFDPASKEERSEIIIVPKD